MAELEADTGGAPLMDEGDDPLPGIALLVVPQAGAAGGDAADPRQKVRSWWDLDELTAMYADFLHRYGPVLDAVTHREPRPLEAFRTYVPMLTQWRRMPRGSSMGARSSDLLLP
ncbi:hypothetical protein GCM10009577_14480 [Streptomyces javensis]